MTYYKKLSEAALCKKNNLNTVKFVAAMLVIVSHAYAFAGNYRKTDWFSLLTHQKGDLGGLAVSIFFFYSGLLITMSLFRNGDVKRYVKRRATRIYPSFVLVTLVIVFVAAPIITNLSVVSYFTNIETYAYLKNLIFISAHDLPGVFVNNIYARAVNGPIWTIRVEVFCYVFCYIFYRLNMLNKNKKSTILSFVTFAVLLGFIAVIYVFVTKDIYSVVMPVTMYYIGMIYAVYSDNIALNVRQLLISTVGFLLFSVLGQVILASIIFLPLMLVNLAFGFDKDVKLTNMLGQSSYEIYLWGGFIGQTVCYMFGGSMNEYVNMLITIPVTILLGYVTNVVVEGENT